MPLADRGQAQKKTVTVSLPFVLLFRRWVFVLPHLAQGQTKVTGPFRIEGQSQGIPDRFGLGVIDKHFSPHHHLRDIPKNPLGTEPSEQEYVSGEGFHRGESSLMFQASFLIKVE